MRGEAGRIQTNGRETKPSRPPRTAFKTRRFYKIGPDYRLGSLGLTLKNEKLLRRPGHIIFAQDLDNPGFPDFPEPPRFRHEKRKGRLPRDFDQISGYWIVSDCMKAVLEAVDPEAFAFARCELLLDDGTPGPTHWLCDVVRALDALDEAASDARIEYDRGKKVYNIVGTKRLIFKTEIVGEAHVFRMAHIEPQIICDNILRNACKGYGIRGVRFRDTISA